jgi:hypothetical protein
MLATTRRLLQLTTRNAENLLLLSSMQSGKESREARPGEIRAIVRFVYRKLADSALRGQTLKAYNLVLKPNLPTVRTELDRVFPAGYDNGENLEGIPLRRFAQRLMGTYGFKKNTTMVTQSSCANALHQGLQAKFFGLVQSWQASMTVDEAVEDLTDLTFVYDIE